MSPHSRVKSFSLIIDIDTLSQAIHKACEGATTIKTKAAEERIPGARHRTLDTSEDRSQGWTKKGIER